MPVGSIHVLLIEDNEAHAVLVRSHLAAVRDRRITTEWVEELAAGVERVRKGGIDAVLLDLGLPDSEPPQTLQTFLDAAPDTPVIVLTTLDDLNMAVESVQKGAQDNLVKTQVTPELLTRSIGYAIERKRSQLAMERYAEELERSNHDFQIFAHVAAHELKSPLWSVSLACELLAEKHRGTLDADSAELIQGMLASVRQMTGLINDLLEFARVEGQARPPQRVEMDHVFDDGVNNLKAVIEKSGAVVSRGELPIVFADPTQARQLLQNLIGNAIKYRDESRTPQVHVSAVRNAAQWVISVRDNGLGVPPESRKRIFGLFERAHDRQKYPGTGLGLAICKRIAERHGGQIWLESQVGQGSTFHFTLPAEPSQPSA